MAQETKSKEAEIIYEPKQFCTAWQRVTLHNGCPADVRISYKAEFKKDIQYNAEILDLPQQEIDKVAEKHYERPAILEPSLISFADDELIAVIVDDYASVTKKTLCIEILLGRSCQDRVLPDVVYQQLATEKLKISWRNTLLLSLEHVQIENLDLRQKMAKLILTLCPSIKGETHPRSRMALAAAVRTLPTIMDDPNQAVHLLQFLTTEYPIKIRRIALRGIREMACFPAPGNIPEGIVTAIAEELVCCARYLLRQSVCPKSEEEYDLGLDIIETLISLGYDALPSLIVELETLHEKWTIDQLKIFMSDSTDRWEKCAPTFYTAKQNLIVTTAETLDNIHIS